MSENSKMKTENIYAKAVEIFFTKDQDITPLVKMGMNENSAKDTIRCYTKLITGEPFNRSIQQDIIKVLLRKLHENQEEEQLRNVLKALSKHFEIRLEKYNQKNIGAREIVSAYKKKLLLMSDEARFSYPDEIGQTVESSLQEGAKKQVVVNAYERNPKARRKCIEHYGPSCYICSFNFQHFYGDEATGFIHVHHVKPLSEIAENYVVDPIKDLRPLCPNCHAIVHLSCNCKTLEEVQERIKIIAQ